MRELVLTPEALDDIRATYRWYEEQREGLGAAFERSVEAALLMIQRHPESFQEVVAPFRRIVLRRYPYRLFYSFDQFSVQAMLLLHTSQDPSIILHRLRNH